MFSLWSIFSGSPATPVCPGKIKVPGIPKPLSLKT